MDYGRDRALMRTAKHSSLRRAVKSKLQHCFEPLEPRQLLSVSALAPLTTAAAQPAGTLVVSMVDTSATVHVSQTFSVKVTVTNPGQTTISSVTPGLTQPAGQLVQARYYSPAVASIAPGKSAVFTFLLMELVTGTETITANAYSPFASSSGSVSTTVNVSSKTIGTSALTDASGDAYLRVGKSTVPVQILDKNTGLPISGLAVAIEPANKQDSRAVLVIADSENRYPLQMAVLQGASAAHASVAPDMSSAALGSAPGASAPTAVDVSSGAGTALSAAVGAVETGFLPSFNAAASTGTVAGAFEAALKALSTSKLPLPLPFAGGGAPKTLYSSGPVQVPQAMTRLSEIIPEFVKTASVGEVIVGGLELVTAGEISLPLAAVMLTSDFAFSSASNILFDETDVQNVDISVESCGGFPFIVVTPDLPRGDSQITFTAADPVADVTIDPTDSAGQPISGGSYELISKDDLANDIVGVLSPDGDTAVPVKAGDYTVQVSSPGFQQSTNESVDVTSSGAVVQPEMAADPIVSGTLSTPLGQATGFLAPGTQYYLTPQFFDAAGNQVQPVGPVYYQVHNPVGSIVATVNPTTGLVTMQSGFGAALITAWCDGVSTTAKLVSTNGNGKYPVQPATPFAVSPTALHFTAAQGSNPPSQSFNVTGLSSKFTNFSYTDQIGWLTVASAGVAGYNVFNVSVDTTGLAPGNYSLPITITDDNSSYRQTVTVSLTVVAQPTPTLAGTYSGPWTYQVFGFGDDYATLVWHIEQSGNNITGSYTSTILDGSVDETGTVNTDTFTGTIEGDSIVLEDTGGTDFFGTVSGNTIVGTSNYLQVTSSFTLTAQG